MILYVCVFVGKCENSSYTEPIFIKTRHRAHIVSHSHPRAHTQTLTRARALSRPSSFAQITQAYITNNSEFIPFHFWFYYRCFRFGHGLWYTYIYNSARALLSACTVKDTSPEWEMTNELT